MTKTTKYILRYWLIVSLFKWAIILIINCYLFVLWNSVDFNKFLLDESNLDSEFKNQVIMLSLFSIFLYLEYSIFMLIDYLLSSNDRKAETTT